MPRPDRRMMEHTKLPWKFEKDEEACNNHDRLKALNLELVAALQGLINEQNGPPLIRDQESWMDAMAVAAAVLSKVKP